MICKYKKVLIVSLMFCMWISFLQGQNTEKLFLSGLDKDHTVDWEFKVSGGRNSGEWSSIPVPSNWEMQGFGTYRYWSDWVENPAPDSVGHYKFKFKVSNDWSNKKIEIAFGGSMTDTKVLVNGKQAGPVHQGGFYEFRYDITDLLRQNEDNLLEVIVHRYSSNHSINLAERRVDFWLYSGIYRPVWLEAFPKEHMERIAVDAKHTGDISIDVILNGVKKGTTLVAEVVDLKGELIGSPFSIPVEKDSKSINLKSNIPQIEPWTAEWPTLYKVNIKLTRGKDILHHVSEIIGFRTVEVRKHDGFYINGIKTHLRGSNRHTFWPTSGKTTSKQLSIDDINLMKDMNMNAVRMSHYPPDPHFLDVADSLGLYVIDELTGWQDAYDTEVGEKLVKELIVRDVNHPSIVLWANGNEGGWNRELDDDFDIYDPQKRTVIHPWDNFNGINTFHYEEYDCCSGTFMHGNDLIMPTEFLHGLYDGGHGAGLNDWWNQMMQNPLTIGGFLWAFADEGIVRDDLGGKIDVAGNRAPDGILGPYREKEASFYTIKEIWSPVYIPLSELDVLPKEFDGKLTVENRYDHTNLDQLKYEWDLISFPSVGKKDIKNEIIASGTGAISSITPGETGTLSIQVPEKWQNGDAFFLTATDPHGRHVYTWTWMLKRPVELAMEVIGRKEGKVEMQEKGNVLIITSGDTELSIENKSGLLLNVSQNGKQISFKDGPVLLSGTSTFKEINHWEEGDDQVVEAIYEGNLKKINWRIMPGGWIKLTYAYHYKNTNELDYLGVTFAYPEEHVKGIKWLGKGPYRVWKNRLKGVEFGVWEKEYNDVMTGLAWNYPEFKGFHDDLYWATLETKEGPITMVTETDDLFLRLFTPSEPKVEGFDPRTTHVDFPKGDISFLRGIAPIGTKFYPASSHGPEGQVNKVPRLGQWYEDTIYFYFGELQTKD